MTKSTWDRRIPARGLAVLALAGALLVPCARAHSQEADREDLKAAYIYNFLKFTDWPPGALGEGERPIVVGVLDEPGLTAALREALFRKQVYDHPIAVRRIDEPADIHGCHVLFVGTRTPEGMRDALSHAHGAPMLTLGDGVAFIDAGGMLAFEERGHELSFVASPEAAARVRLSLDSQLLRLAVVRGPSRP